MGGNTSKPETKNTQGLMISQSEMATFNIHQDTLSLVLTVLGVTILVIAILWFIRKYHRKAQQARPIQAARMLHNMEMQAGTAAPRNLPFLFKAALPHLQMFHQHQPTSAAVITAPQGMPPSVQYTSEG